MGFDAMRKAAAESEKRDLHFDKRVSTQQFLNCVAPIFKAYASGGMPSADLIEGTGLRDYAETARRLAVSVVARMTNTMPNAVDPHMVRILMPMMGEFVARKIEADIPVDVVADTVAIVSAIDLADPKFDTNPFEKDQVAPSASLRMTASAGIAAILAQLAWYDFRSEDPSAVGSRLLDAVIVRSARTVMAIASDMSERDRTSLMQSFVKHHSEIMANTVANRGAATLAALRKLDAGGRDDWYRDNDPVADALGRFETLTSGLEAAYSTWDAAMKDPASVAPEAQATPGTP